MARDFPSCNNAKLKLRVESEDLDRFLTAKNNNDKKGSYFPCLDFCANARSVPQNIVAKSCSVEKNTRRHNICGTCSVPVTKRQPALIHASLQAISKKIRSEQNVGQILRLFSKGIFHRRQLLRP